MALVGRNSRRRSVKWWLAAGVVLTLVVLLIDASVKSRSPGPVRVLAAQDWVDRALPIVAQSTAQGAEINAVRASGLSMTASGITAELDQAAAGARSSFQSAEALRPPPNIATADGALVVCLQTRAQAAASVAAAMAQTLSGPTGTAAAAPAASIQTAGQQFQVADQAYRLFVQDMPALGVKLPASEWYTDPAAFAQPGLSTFLQALRATTNAVPTHDVAVESLSTEPGAVSSIGAVQVLPPSSTISVQVTVANVGNQPESNVTVTAALSPSAPGFVASVREFVSLTPGQARALTLGSLRPPTAVPVTLTVTVGPIPGAATTADNTKSITFRMP